MTIETMKKYSKRLFSGFMVTLLLGGNLISSVGAYAETVPTEPKTGETTGGEAPTPPNGEKETSLPNLQDNLPKPTEPPVKEPPKAEEPKVDSKAKANPKEEPAKETESEDDEELPKLSNLEAGDSPKAPITGPGEDEQVYYEDDIGSSNIWLSNTYSDETITLHISGGDFGDTSNNPGWQGSWNFPDNLDLINAIDIVKIEGPLILPENVSRMFENFSARTFEGTHYLDTSHVTNMDRMFAESAFEKLDLSSFDTSHVENMKRMFVKMPNLREVNVSSFDTTRVTNMDGMFGGTTSLDELNLSSFNTNNVEIFNNMFRESHLATLDLSNFNLENKEATSMMLDMINLNKVILGPNTRLNRDIYWGLESDGELPYSWKNVDKSDSPLIRPYTFVNEYNTNVSELSGTYIRIKGKPLISVHDSTVYIDTPNGIKSSKDWEPKDNLDYAYEANGKSIDIKNIDVDELEDYNPSVPGKYRIQYSITISGYDEIIAIANITVKERKEVTLHVNYYDEHSGEVFTVKEATVKREFGQPFDILGELENPYFYKVDSMFIENRIVSDEYDIPPVDYTNTDDGKGNMYPILEYEPSWDDDQKVRVYLSSNENPTKIETNPLTFNLGQSNPGDLKSAIKSISLDWNTDPFVVRISKNADPSSDSYIDSFRVENNFEQRRPAMDLSPGIQLGFDQATFTSVVSTVGTKTLPVKVMIPLLHESNKDVEQTVNVPVTVQLGNALALRSSGNHYVMYLPLDAVSNPNTFSVKAVHADSGNNIIHPSVSGVYYSIGFLSRAQGVSLNTAPDWNININGASVRSLDAVNSINAVDHMFDKNNTNIIKVHHTDAIIWGDTFGLITNGAYTRITRSTGPGLTSSDFFFEMTADGYKLLTLNQLTPKNGQSIFKNASHAYLDAHVKDFIDIDRYPGLTVAWSEYPDTSTEGAKPGKLLVTQKSSTGKDLTYEYPVNVNVVPGSVQLVVSDADFGTIENNEHGKVKDSKGYAYIMDSTNVGSDSDIEKHYHITASIADKNEGLAPYLYFLNELAFRNDLNNRPDFTGEVRQSEELYAEYMTKNGSMYNLINSIQMDLKVSFFGSIEPDFISLDNFRRFPYSYDEHFQDNINHEALLSLELIIPKNTPLKVGQNRATITWDIAEVP
ncbi:BspA family leucine-rich repeat surface protein [Enterococcus faecalis]|uniref:BspA family leucine-rich repeat surface protein n=1 Tax=Enterococcus faecalis TaxID=1351 RepID=UPI002FBE975B